MAIRRNLSSPLAASEFDYTVTPRKKKKKRTVKVTRDDKGTTVTVKRRSGASKTKFTNKAGTKTVSAKRDKAGNIKKRTTKELTKPMTRFGHREGVSNVRVTKEKKGKPKQTYILTHSDSGAGYGTDAKKVELDVARARKTAKRKSINQAARAYKKTTEGKAKIAKRKQESKEARKEKRAFNKSQRQNSMKRYKRKEKFEKFKKNFRKTHQGIENRKDRKICRNPVSGTKKCPSARKKLKAARGK